MPRERGSVCCPGREVGRDRRTRSARPTVHWRRNCIRTSIPGIVRPRRSSSRSPPPTTSSAMRRSAGATTAARSTRPETSGRASATTVISKSPARKPTATATTRATPISWTRTSCARCSRAAAAERGFARGGRTHSTACRSISWRPSTAPPNASPCPMAARSTWSFPPGTKDKQVLRLRGKGGPGLGGGPAGRRPGRGRGSAAQVLHPRRRRHPRRAADQPAGSGAGSEARRPHARPGPCA